MPNLLTILDLVILRAVLALDGVTISYGADEQEIGRKFAAEYRDRKIYGIKQVRQVSGLTLLDAKNFVERILAQFPPLPENAVERADVVSIREAAERVAEDVRAGYVDDWTQRQVDELLSLIDKALGV